MQYPRVYKHFLKLITNNLSFGTKSNKIISQILLKCLHTELILDHLIENQKFSSLN